ncbi:MAG: hypothetical protein DRI34_11260 [Deltaproteobacteria bacterium]|nr:MAG: hypothetical protein DRI34_11260 [Deltaproteobacteria bacterium]
MIHRRTTLLLAVVLMLASSSVLAQGAEGFDSERFKPSLDSQGVFVTEGGRGEESGDINVGLLFNYSRNPLVIIRNGAILHSLVSDRVAADFMVSMGMTDWLTIGVDVPAIFYQDGAMIDESTGADRGLTAAALGDIRVVPKLTALREEKHGISLALSVPLTLPSGEEGAFLGSNSVTLAPTVAVSRRLLGERLLLAANIGAWLLTENASYRDLEAGHELFYRLGAGYRFAKDWWGLGEIFGSSRIKNLFHNRPSEVPLEWLLGLRYQGPWDLTFTVGGGGGLQPGWGTPNYRFFLGVMWSPRVRDSDSDGVTDEDDRCPREPGPAENGGCPWGDADADGVTDDIDNCVNRPGPPENQGCPWGDKDSDGLTDNVDKCPEQPEDKDGFQDDDGCPDPDNDGDGITDAKDKCPDDKGTVEHQGCPFSDQDADGLADKEDKCPEQAGPRENQGCPWGDQDEDGLTDNVDKCPRQAEDKDGFEDDDGCPDPDNDKDGIPDDKDKCPLEPETINGVKDSDGCPDKGRVVVIVRKKKIEILQKVYFATGRSTILRRSYRLLDQVAQVLRGHSEIKRVRIEGHTDSRGSERFNQRLSEARARSVMRYLVKKGGIDPARLEAVGYGESKPIADNKTRKGREANRRVEFTILETE